MGICISTDGCRSDEVYSLVRKTWLTSTNSRHSRGIPLSIECHVYKAIIKADCRFWHRNEAARSRFAKTVAVLAPSSTHC